MTIRLPQDPQKLCQEPPVLQNSNWKKTGQKWDFLISQLKRHFLSCFKSWKSSPALGHPCRPLRNPVRNLLSSTTPSGRQEDTPLLDLFRGISERRQENKSCLLWPLDNFRNPARNLQSSTTPASRHKDTYSLYLFWVCLSQVFLFSEISIFCLWQIWEF